MHSGCLCALLTRGKYEVTELPQASIKASWDDPGDLVADEGCEWVRMKYVLI